MKKYQILSVFTCDKSSGVIDCNTLVYRNIFSVNSFPKEIDFLVGATIATPADYPFFNIKFDFFDEKDQALTQEVHDLEPIAIEVLTNENNISVTTIIFHPEHHIISKPGILKIEATLGQAKNINAILDKKSTMVIVSKTWRGKL
ncbi:hypothetical protein [Limnobaculum xujianqingii]|uniref:hypothetical protein n=1 Tax=Limnobaculum xujianqingii TaxID=2738837 RepID=UPI00112DA1D7|nr:hypothetical protein [Limnobaculum xujianqingii]